MWGSSFVENQSLSHSNPLSVAVNDFVAAGGLPESGSGGAVGAGSCGVLLVFVAEEVPIILRSGSYFAFLWKRKKKKKKEKPLRIMSCMTQKERKVKEKVKSRRKV